MTSAGANTWSVPLELNNLESQIGGAGGSGVQSVSVGNANLTLSGTAQNPIISGTLTALTSNVATTNFALSGNAPGNPSFALTGTEEFKVITSDLTPHILVSGGVSGGVQLGLPSGYGGYKVTAPTVVPATTSDTQVATTAFVQSALASSGNVASVVAGANIGVDNTIPSAPVVSVLNPLTSTLNIGTQLISGASTVGDDTNSVNIVAQNGILNSVALDYSNAVSQQSGNVSSFINGTTAVQATSWADTLLGTTHSSSTQTSAQDNLLSVVAIGTVQGTTATRNDFTNILGFNDSLSFSNTLNTQTTTYTKIVNGSTIQENNQFINPTTSVSNSISETISAGSIVCAKSVNNSGNVGSSSTTLQPTSAYFTQNATGNSGTFIASNEQQADATRTRILIKQSDTGGANPILNQNDLYCSPVSTYYEQQSKNVSGASKTTTLLTSATNGGAILQTDGTLGITSSGNMALNATSGTVAVEGIVFSGAGFTTNFTNSDIDITTNGTGVVHITEAVAGTGALRITQQSAGGSTNPVIKMINTNAGTGTVFVEMYKNKNVAQNDIITQLSFNANDSAGAKQQFGAIECVATNVGAGNQDGALDFYTLVNGGVPSLVFRMNGADNENNSFRPLDMNGNNIKTSSGNLTIDASTSSGAGTITAILKAGGNLIFTNLPTASAGLPAGAVWRNGTVLNIV
jgi:hypothetical protein